MPIASTFNELVRALHALRDGLLALRMTVVEDRPDDERDLSLLVRLGDELDVMSGWLEECAETAREASLAVAYPIDLERARQMLATSTETFERLAGHFSSELGSSRRMGELTALGARRGEWRGWADAANEGLDRCRSLVDHVMNVFFSCWEETTERAAAGGVSVQTTSIGQQIGLVPEEGALRAQGIG